ncbi:LCP family protein [Cellulomonas humilata]|uniref:LCP family protein required for cell wall assembly n=1 Tax=Cellulomonas humilata TaxID=144055 RepID=A0ABU0E9R9_9CELL|nr:LCP family protein [Cellulomonas humilata]MDQ0372001.1 LCP family protein required for cell wall assembly [Cellulomonas humilata]
MSQHARAVPPRRALRAVGLATVGVLVFTVAAAAAVYRELQSNVAEVDLTGLVGDESARPQATEPPPGDARAGSPVNLLIIGSDDRSGENAAIGGENEGMASDTTIVAHVSADRSRVELVSIPRDLMADRPSCTMSDGSTTPARTSRQFNEAFAIGWAEGQDVESASGCTWKTVEALTGVRLDGLVLVDFVGLRDMVEAVGGVPICLPTALSDEDTGLDVPAGAQVFDGTTAVQFARARHDIGDGSDTGRITRQHDLMAAMTRSVLSQEVLTSPTSLLRFAQAATSSLTASQGFRDLTDLTGFGLSLRNLEAERIVFASMPTEPDPRDGNRRVATAAAAELWARIAADQPVGEAPAAPPATDPTAPPAAVDPPWTPPDGVLTSADDSSTTCA